MPAMRGFFTNGARMGAIAMFIAPAVLPFPALAVVGGREGGSMAAETLMVLNDRGGVCSAIVAAPDIVLTAGHCVGAPASLRVHYRDGNGEAVLLQPRASERHPSFQGDAVASRRASVDLGMIRLAKPLPEHFLPATLHAGTQPRAGASVEVSGYGVSRADDQRSTGHYRSAELTVAEPYGPGKILLWAQRRGAGACQGDSGGPMAQGRSVVAVTAWSSGDARTRCGSMTQGVLLGPQRAWLDAVAARWDRSLRWTAP